MTTKVAGTKTRNDGPTETTDADDTAIKGERAVMMEAHLAFAQATLSMLAVYGAENISAKIIFPINESDVACLRLLFNEAAPMSGAEKLKSLKNFSAFLADLMKASPNSEDLQYDATSPDNIISLLYDPAVFGIALDNLRVEKCPTNIFSHRYLTYAGNMMERAENYQPGHKLH